MGQELIDWWGSFSGQWSWSDPVLVLGVITVVVTATIPLFLWWLGSKQSREDAELKRSQAETLARQEAVVRRQRRDSLLEIVGRSADATHLGLLWREVHEFEGSDRKLLLAAFRTNVSLALPGTTEGVAVSEELTERVVGQYVDGLERRYAQGERKTPPYPALLDFIRAAVGQRVRVNASDIVALVTGPTAEHQKPHHGFFRDLVSILPECAGMLIHAVERIDSRHPDGLRLNVLTGTLLAMKDLELGRTRQEAASLKAAVVEVRSSAPEALATLLHRANLRSLDRWSLEGSTEPVTATVAWLVRAVGWLADVDDHLAMRMTENLAEAISLIPAEDRRHGWGIDDKDVQAGFAGIKAKQPLLWRQYGATLESAASKVGPIS